MKQSCPQTGAESACLVFQACMLELPLSPTQWDEVLAGQCLAENQDTQALFLRDGCFPPLPMQKKSELCLPLGLCRGRSSAHGFFQFSQWKGSQPSPFYRVSTAVASAACTGAGACGGAKKYGAKKGSSHGAAGFSCPEIAEGYSTELWICLCILLLCTSIAPGPWDIMLFFHCCHFSICLFMEDQMSACPLHRPERGGRTLC